VTVKTNIKVNPRFLVFATLMTMMVIAATPKTSVAATTYQPFNVTLMPNYTARTPSNYLFGNGTWAGTLYIGSIREWKIVSTVTLTGAEPNTWYIIRVAYFDATGHQFVIYYWGMYTDANGNAMGQVNSRIPKGAVAACLGLYDSTNFFPPLQTMISDPEIGGDDPT